MVLHPAGACSLAAESIDCERMKTDGQSNSRLNEQLPLRVSGPSSTPLGLVQKTIRSCKAHLYKLLAEDTYGIQLPSGLTEGGRTRRPTPRLFSATVLLGHWEPAAR